MVGVPSVLNKRNKFISSSSEMSLSRSKASERGKSQPLMPIKEDFIKKSEDVLSRRDLSARLEDDHTETFDRDENDDL